MSPTAINRSGVNGAGIDKNFGYAVSGYHAVT